MLCDLARMPQIEVRLEALTYVISARWQLREEHSKLQRLAVALEHLNGAAGRQELSLLFGTALTVGHALLSGRQGNAADAGADAAADAAAERKINANAHNNKPNANRTEDRRIWRV